ncbi:sulfite exporter TauE/SafE family protein [Actibacterium sp. XHP0104]|uniref:sulfite exporter TauE/SafE family protein n=1 Tax=Actibacterium sp. XHP0104 TaxID=2984335 RepID=UPI0021E8917D|nr:sulfite exporter TauE/SafE family protein [Actibacterium sp. XHP0104]MCV2881600.1 sulfite exporter TauE/SafE family protein [Actibacterium sp. XHP0104]
MSEQILGIPPEVFAIAAIIAFFAGFVKGVVGFAMPMIMMSGLSMVLPAPVALAALIGATLVTNLSQALRQGAGQAWGAVRRYRRLIGTIIVMIFLSAPLVTWLPQRALYLLLGVPLLFYGLSQLTGRQLVLQPGHRVRAEYMMGVVSGFFGGISGVWGPPVIAYLLSYGTEKTEMVRVQGVVFLVGCVALIVSHLGTGVLNAQTLPLSGALIVPAVAGMLAGFAVQDRLDAALFRKVTLVVLSLAAINLIRRGLM